MTELNIQTELIAFFIQDIPESIIMTLVVFSFLCLRFEWRKVFKIAFLLALFNLVRFLPLAPGMNTVILMIALAVLINVFTGTRMSKAFIAVLVSSVIVLFLEMLYAKPLLQLTGLSYEATFVNPFLRALFSLPYQIVLLVIAIIKNLYNQRGGKFAA